MCTLAGLWIIPFIWSLWGLYWAHAHCVALLHGSDRLGDAASCGQAGWIAGRRASSISTSMAAIASATRARSWATVCSCRTSWACLLLLPDWLVPLSPTGVDADVLRSLLRRGQPRPVCAMLDDDGSQPRLRQPQGRDCQLSRCQPTHAPICDHPLHASVRLTDSKPGEIEEPTFSTPCGHHFHSYCLRGWTIIGKRDTCPCCSEKVNVREVVGKAPWDQTTVAWGTILDALRYMIVFNPCILLVTQFVVNVVW